MQSFDPTGGIVTDLEQRLSKLESLLTVYGRARLAYWASGYQASVGQVAIHAGCSRATAWEAMRDEDKARGVTRGHQESDADLAN